jgi:hypothetical protein
VEILFHLIAVALEQRAFSPANRSVENRDEISERGDVRNIY